MSNLNHNRGILFIILSAIFFGLMGPFAVIAKGDGLSQSSLLLYRFFGAFIVFIFLCIKNGEFKNLTSTNIIPAFLMGAIAYFMQSYFYFSALDYIGVGLTSILLYVYPALVVVILWVHKAQKPTPALWFGILLAFSGVALCFIETKQGITQTRGVYLALAAALTYACYLVISENILNKTSPLLVSTFVCLGAACAYFSKIIFQENFTLPESLQGYLALIGLTLFSTVLAILLIFKGLEIIGASRAAILSSIEPITAVLLGTLFMQETFSIQKFFGFCLVMISVIYISRQTNTTK